MIKNSGFNFSNIRNIIQAAELLQEAGKDDDCQKLLKDLSDAIKQTHQSD